MSAEKVGFAALANGHSIAALLQRLPSGNEFRSELAGLAHLEAYATAFRHPTPSGKFKPVADLPALRNALSLLSILITDVAAYCEDLPSA